MASDKITIDRTLFEDLTECAIDCEANTRWRRDDPRQCRQWDKRIPDIMAKAVAIRDAPPQVMTDCEREAWTEAGAYEVQLQAAAQRLQAVLLRPRPVDSLDVVEAVDELIAKHSEAIEQIREAQRKIIEWVTRMDVHTDLQVWQGVGDVPVVIVGISDVNQPDHRTTEIDKSRCLLVQIAEAIDAWKRIHLPPSASSE